MKRNYLHTVVWVTIGLLLSLLLMRWIPSPVIGDWQARPLDIIADVIAQPADSTNDVSLDSSSPHQIKQSQDSCPPGVTCIMDFANDSAQGMEPLYRALSQVNSLGRPVRIAVLGDSYIEGDIVTAKLRELLQKRFGGHGAGLVPITSDSPGFRHTIGHTFGNWESHHGNDHSGYSATWANITGHYFTPKQKAWVELRGEKKFLTLLDSCRISSLYFSATASTTVVASVNGDDPQYFSVQPATGVSALSVTGRIGRVRWEIPAGDSHITCYAASFDCDHGVLVDNYGLRSASGYHLALISDDMMRSFDAVRHYDLIVFAYGMNVASRNRNDYSAYIAKIRPTIERFKQNMPQTGFLIMSVADHEERTSDGFRTLPGILNLIAAQRQLAQDCNIAFWNLYEAMGGQGSVVEMAKNHEANLDYTHVNHKGGMRLGKLLFDAIEWGERQYEKSHPKQ